jgi:hypothetical protein
MPHQTVSARRTDLRKGGYTDYLRDADNQQVRRPTRSGRGAFVEIATRLGKDTIKLGLQIRLNGDPTRGRRKGNPASRDAFRSIDAERGHGEFSSTW